MDRRSALVLATLVLACAPAYGRGAEPPGAPDLRRPPGSGLETSVADGFTLAAVGDCITSRPLAQLVERDPEFAAVVEPLRRADVAFGNLETTILDIRKFGGHPHAGAQDWALVAAPGVASDLKEMGFDLLSRANNHALDWGIEGMRETGEWLDRAGLVHAGAGETRPAARAARYLETPKGRVALVSMASTFREYSDALPPRGEAPGRPGLSALRLRPVTVVPEAVMSDLAAVARRVRDEQKTCTFETATPDSPPPLKPGGAVPPELELFGVSFRQGAALEQRYEPDEADVGEILKSIRQGKQHADLLVATIHAHETSLDCERPGDFLPVLARAAIDAGADLFAVHGSHKLGGIEIYKGRPIFYGLGNFFWSDIQEPLSADLYETYREAAARALAGPAESTDADLNAYLNSWGFNDEWVFRAMVAVSRFEGGQAAEIRLYPVDLGYGRRLTESGMPRRASPAAARALLERLQRQSAPYGTEVRIEGDVGVIRPAGPARGD